MRPLFHCVVTIYLHGLFCIRFWWLGDENQVLLISVSPEPSTELSKQWMLHQGLLTGRRTESISGRRMQKAYWETKLESSILTKRNPMTFYITEKGFYVATMPYFSSSFPDSSFGKEFACNARDTSSIPGSGRSAGEGIGYPFQYSGLENSMDCI